MKKKKNTTNRERVFEDRQVIFNRIQKMVKSAKSKNDFLTRRQLAISDYVENQIKIYHVVWSGNGEFMRLVCLLEWFDKRKKVMRYEEVRLNFVYRNVPGRCLWPCQKFNSGTGWRESQVRFIKAMKKYWDEVEPKLSIEEPVGSIDCPWSEG